MTQSHTMDCVQLRKQKQKLTIDPYRFRPLNVTLFCKHISLHGVESNGTSAKDGHVVCIESKQQSNLRYENM